MTEKTVQQRLTDLDDEILRLEGGQDALLYCIAQMVRRSTAHMSVQQAADLFDSFVVNVDPEIVATWPARKKRAYEHQVQSGKRKEIPSPAAVYATWAVWERRGERLVEVAVVQP